VVIVLVDLLAPGDVDEDAVHRVALAAGVLHDLGTEHREPATLGQTGRVVADRSRLGCGRGISQPLGPLARCRLLPFGSEERDGQRHRNSDATQGFRLRSP
jgi:hypothetical protein